VGFWADFVSRWRSSRSFQLRRPVHETYSADGYFKQRVDFVEMQVLQQLTSPDPTVNAASWPTLQELRRLDGLRWEVRPHPTYIGHRLAELRGRGSLEDPSPLLSSERTELERLTTGNIPWEEWGWGSRIEPAYQLFLSRYQDAARQGVSSLESMYLEAWRREAERMGKSRSPSRPA
jgi:hypothetical protein